jgi:RsiW-degrading membrane proteinase PrsW (M82 family)
MIPGMVTAIAIPLLFLALVRWLDLYASGSLKGVLICLGGGVVAYWLALSINDAVRSRVGDAVLITLAAPVVEEILKSLILIYAVRRADFTYFVDGAVYGFAAGTAFAVLENTFYLIGVGGGTALVVAIGRAFSTSLMHGSASALVGVSLGRLRYGRGTSRFASLLLGWAAAVALHVGFNNVVYRGAGALAQVAAVAIGVGGVGLIAAFIFWGLAEERRWLRETLGLQVGVSAGEAAVVQKLDDLDALLAPVGEHFGPERRKQVGAFLKLQAQLGLKRKAQELTRDARLRAELDAQVAALRGEIDAVRRELGVYCMSYVRSILPSESEPLWARLGQAIETSARRSGPSLWRAIEVKVDGRSGDDDRPSAGREEETR